MWAEAFEKWGYLPPRLFPFPVGWKGREQGNLGGCVLKTGRAPLPPVLERQHKICCQNEHLRWTVMVERNKLLYSFSCWIFVTHYNYSSWAYPNMKGWTLISVETERSRARVAWGSHRSQRRRLPCAARLMPCGGDGWYLHSALKTEKRTAMLRNSGWDTFRGLSEGSGG